jgi:hypothetical protein
LRELAFLWFQEEGLLSHDFKVFVCDLIVELGIIGRGDDKIIHVPMYVSWVLSFQRGKNAVHHALEGGGGIVETKRHDFGFEEPFLCFDGRNPLAVQVDPNVVVPITDIEFGH